MDDFSFNGQQDVVGGQKKNTISCAIYGGNPLNFNTLAPLKKMFRWAKCVKKQKKRNTLN